MTGKFEFIDAEYALYLESDEQYVPPVVKMCRWMEVSRSGFYEWRNAPESATSKRRGMLALIVKKSFDDSNEAYGLPPGPRGPGGLGRASRAGAGTVADA